jgi:hypothetical protein
MYLCLHDIFLLVKIQGPCFVWANIFSRFLSATLSYETWLNQREAKAGSVAEIISVAVNEASLQSAFLYYVYA